MAEETFKAGDIVYHKVNNLRMVVLRVANHIVVCRFINPSGNFDNKEFNSFELAKNSPSNEMVTYQLESKTSPK